MHVRLFSGGAATALVCAASLVSAGGAQASNASMRAVIRHSAPAITRSQARLLNGLAAYQQSHTTGKLIRAIGLQDHALSALRTKISAQTPSNATGARAKADVVNGLALILSSNEMLITDLRANKVSKAQLRPVVATGVKGNVELAKGAKLLKA